MGVLAAPVQRLLHVHPLWAHSPLPVQVSGWSWLPMLPDPRHASPFMVFQSLVCPSGRLYPCLRGCLLPDCFLPLLSSSHFSGPVPLLFSLLPLPGPVPAEKGLAGQFQGLEGQAPGVTVAQWGLVSWVS